MYQYKHRHTHTQIPTQVHNIINYLFINYWSHSLNNIFKKPTQNLTEQETRSRINMAFSVAIRSTHTKLKADLFNLCADFLKCMYIYLK